MWCNVVKGVSPTSLAALFFGWTNEPMKNVHYPTRYYSTTRLLSSLAYPTLPEIEKPLPFRPCHGSQNCGYWASWGPTIIFSEKKSPYLNNLSPIHIEFPSKELSVITIKEEEVSYSPSDKELASLAAVKHFLLFSYNPTPRIALSVRWLVRPLPKNIASNAHAHT